MEIFPEYINRHALELIYDEIFIADIIDFSINAYDMIIAGDILEHLSKADAIKVVDALRTKCRFLWAALPVKIDRPWSEGYTQGKDEYEENRANKHLHDWTGQEIIGEFYPLWLVPFITTGTFLVEGDIR